MDTLVAIRMRAVSELCWASLGSASPQLALDGTVRAETLIDADKRFSGYLPWILIARAESQRALGRVEEGIATLETISKTDDRAYKTAREKIKSFREGG